MKEYEENIKEYDGTCGKYENMKEYDRTTGGKYEGIPPTIDSGT